MTDDNEVCPLCCEELDISDRQFFPCKCGYQVCMWCWHRIRENENGLCPACRTPYGDDPHEFSAVDMEEVVRANKEKAAAERREKERLRAAQLRERAEARAAAGPSTALREDPSPALPETSLAVHDRGPAPAPTAVGGSSRDRTQLANMRVIRRNLVYAVGLPPAAASEEALRRPEHFGQYGRIGKVVLNRSHIGGGGDPRRASASAYVTFDHKEDALTCILALDGFYLDNRNIRASYGTSKYCSAFIKNVRCNNPDCTYLHCMGENEDTFTKQEIQAGYVTSGRDVLARLQATNGPPSRRRTGGGGPSSSGRVSSTPVFPPPVYDIPPERHAVRQASPVVQRAIPTPAPPPVPRAPPRARSSSTGSGTGSVPPEPRAAHELLARQQEELRKLHPQNSASGTAPVAPAPQRRSASSVVAGGPAPRAVQSTARPALEALGRGSAPTRTVSAGVGRARPPVAAPRETSMGRRTPAVGRQQQDVMKVSLRGRSVSIGTSAAPGTIGGASGIGGAVIVGSKVDVGGAQVGTVAPIGRGQAPSRPAVGVVGGPVGSPAPGPAIPLGGYMEESKSSAFGSRKPGVDGGGVTQGNPFSNFPISIPQPPAPVGRMPVGQPQYGSGSGSYTGTGGLFSNTAFSGIGGGGIWSSDPSSGLGRNGVGGTGGGVGESSLAKNPYEGSGSSALASILGIELPTGSGSLRDSASYLGPGPHNMGPSGISAAPGPVSHGAVGNNDHSSLWGSSGLNFQGDTGPQNFLRSTGSGGNLFDVKTGPVGSVGLAPGGGAYNRVENGGNGSSGSVGGGNSDIAFLQSLLPGVHITSGNAHQPAAPAPVGGRVAAGSGGGWGALPPYYEAAPGGEKSREGQGNSSGSWQFPNQNSIW